ncbi:ABC transporter substrate-binding protein [Alkalicoccus luteus]|uniref:ABC transporter substrate-binding protein n=1 Tax=Alkalicoccus luteus TaxID=1237094 RepID=A0A969PX91_9BACI|nr:ABC transporter substrate-binding protein [Alkalicoccus luteus]NJP39139.1 ABC transporter substrate-binding protein [Alkalicoccus luteus]
MKKMTAPLLLSAALIISACGTEGNNENGNTNTDNQEANENTADSNEVEEEEEAATNSENDEADEGNENNETAGEFPVTITDNAGNEVTIDEEPETIVTLQPSDTEILFEIGAGDRLVGVSEYCNYPEEALEIENVGAQDMDVERILSLEPDMALVSDYHASSHDDILEQFRDAGIDVVVVRNAESFEGTYDTIETLGMLTGTEENAEELIAEMESGMEELAELGETIDEEERKRVWVEVAPSPDIFTTGTGTFMHEMLETIGAENAAEEHEGWVNLTEEEIVSLEPDTIVTTYGYYVEDPQEEVMNRDGWADVPAVENEDVHDVQSDIVTRSGPRLVEGTRAVAEAVYPDVFE